MDSRPTRSDYFTTDPHAATKFPQFGNWKPVDDTTGEDGNVGNVEPLSKQDILNKVKFFLENSNRATRRKAGFRNPRKHKRIRMRKRVR